MKRFCFTGAIKGQARLAVVFALLLLVACGQTGALYFDEAPPADQLPPSKKSQPVSTIPQPAPVDDTERPAKK